MSHQEVDRLYYSLSPRFEKQLNFCKPKILLQQTYVHWNIYITDTQNLLLRVSALNGCHNQGVFTLDKLVLSKWLVVCSKDTHTYMYQNFSLQHKKIHPINVKMLNTQ